MKIFVVVFVTVVLYALVDQYNAKESEDVDNEIDDSVLETWKAPEDLKKNYPCYMSGYDKKGRPVWISEFGSWDVKEIVNGGFLKTLKFDTYFADLLSRKFQSTKKNDGTKVNKKDLGWVCIIDMDKYSSSQLMSLSTLSYVTKLVEKLEAGAKNMDYAYFINVNSIAETFLNQMKPTLEQLMGKSEIYGTNKAKWQGAILKRIPKYSLPEKYGGYANFTPIEM